MNPEKLDNWIKQLEVYCIIQNISNNKTKIQLATLRMGGGTNLIQWESKTQIDVKRKGKAISSWSKFLKSLRKQFYPLGYMQLVVIDWQHLRQGKGKSVHEFTQEFRKKALALSISLDTLETLLKYIDNLYSYLQHTLLMFNPNDFDEVCVQAIHIESGGRPFKFSPQSSKELEIKHSNDSKRKNNSKGKKSATAQKERPTCSHCQRIGHDESRCWKPHPELKPKKFLKEKDEMKANAAIQQDLGFDSSDERRITAIVSTGKTSDTGSSSNTNASSSNINPSNEDKRVELFNIRITSKNTKIDTMSDNRPQANIISEYLVKNLDLETQNHPRPYPLVWLNKQTQVKVTKQCRLRFSITANYIDEVELDVVPVDICEVVLGSPYLYDRDALFYRRQNKYHLMKYGVEFIVRAHKSKNHLNLVVYNQMK